MDVIIQKHPALYASNRGEEFLAFAPYSLSAKEQIKNAIFAKKYPRDELTAILAKYNAQIENDAEAFQNIQKLKNSSSVCVITGQQLGFMGGPAYTILKGISCLLLAKELDAVPIFWLATEDHDIHEIDHTYLIDSWGNLKDYKLNFPERHLAIDDLLLNSKHHETIERFLAQAPLNFSFTMHDGFAMTMAGFLAKLFKGTGLVFVEPKCLRELSKPFFCKELHHHKEILALLQDSKEQLQQRGEDAPLPATAGPQLFLKMSDGERERIVATGDSFLIKGRSYSIKELEEIIDKTPENFSTNASSRPVLQSSLFPTAAYVAGPTELNYYRQLRNYHQFHDVPMPWIVPRLAGTFLTPEANYFLHKLGLDPWSPIPLHWDDLMPELKSDLARLKGEWEHAALRLFSEELSKKTVDRYIRHLLTRFEKKIYSARLQKQGIPLHALHYLRNLLHPHQHQQERVLNWCAFQSVSKKNLIRECLHILKWDISGHFYFAL